MWLVLLGLLLWNLVTFLPRARPEVELPYAAFIAQVKASNVTEVEIRGPRITGALRAPLLWPPAKVVPTPAPASPAPLAGTQDETRYSRFRTLFPEVVGDPALLALLEDRGVVVKVAQPSSPWFVTLLVDWAPMLLLVGFFVWMGRQAQRQQGSILGFGRTRARRYSAESPPSRRSSTMERVRWRAASRRVAR